MSDIFKGDDLPPLVIVKKKKQPAGAHGGAWKIAYADFVTAMMAFFLLLWLLNVTTEESIIGISDFFAPPDFTETDTAVGKALSGMAVAIEGALRSASSRPSVTVAITTYGKEEAGEQTGEIRKDIELVEMNKNQLNNDESEQDSLAETINQIRLSIEEIPDFQDMQDSLLIEITPEGLRIQILDLEKKAMFKPNSAIMTNKARRFLGLVGSLVSRLPNKLSITGHTEKNDYRRGANYGNWELSSDRAVAARKRLVAAGVSGEQILQVEGKAETEPLEKRNPESERNRRISLLLAYAESDT